MYFNNKQDTNIDKEFQNNNNSILSNILEMIKKYKMIVFIAIALIIIILIIIIFATSRKTNYLILNGEEAITIYQGSDYIEAGFKAYNSKEADLSNNVIIESTLDTDKIGEYEITYTLGRIVKTRIVNVIEKPKEYTYIYLTTVNNKVDVYLKVGEKYNEPGYQVLNSNGKLLTEEVKITGTVDTSKKGNYKLIYSVVDSNNVTVSVTRTVVVE